MLISVFASMSTSLSSFQHLHKPYPILLLSGFWRLASAYFYELHFPSGAVSGTELKLIGSHLACLCCFKKIRELCFLLGNTAPCFDTIVIFCNFSSCLISLSFSIYYNLSTVCLYVGINILNKHQPSIAEN